MLLLSYETDSSKLNKVCVKAVALTDAQNLRGARPELHGQQEAGEGSVSDLHSAATDLSRSDHSMTDGTHSGPQPAELPAPSQTSRCARNTLHVRFFRKGNERNEKESKRQLIPYFS